MKSCAKYHHQDYLLLAVPNNKLVESGPLFLFPDLGGWKKINTKMFVIVIVLICESIWMSTKEEKSLDMIATATFAPHG